MGPSEKELLLSAERTQQGFRLHLRDGAATMRVRRSERRRIEAALRSVGVVVVDEFGAIVDDSQFEKEADPAFNRRIGPGFVGFLAMAFGPRWLAGLIHQRHMRQLSDDA